MSILELISICVMIVASSALSFGLGHVLASRRQERRKTELAARLHHLEEEVQRSLQKNEAFQKEQARLVEALNKEKLVANTVSTQLRASTDALLAKEEEIRNSRQEMKEQAGRYEQLQREHIALKTRLHAKEEHFKEQLHQLDEAKASLGKAFENLANRIFEERGKAFADTHQTSLTNLLKPFRERIEAFEKRMNDVHDSASRSHVALNKEIEKVLDIGRHMSSEAHNLTTALKGDSQQRGAWGEAQLRRTLEICGLVKGEHYDAQRAFTDPQGRQKRIDYLINLPDNKHIIIDSKLSLNAYESAMSLDTRDDAYHKAMDAHVKSVYKHIDDLSSKDYTNLIGMNSPNFVLMFMPIEPAYIESLKHDTSLFEYGCRKGIILVSHTTLIPILRTVSNIWMIERSNQEAYEISKRAGEIHNSVSLIAERVQKLGKTLGTASGHYNDVVTALAGKQGLSGKVERFKDISTKVSKPIPKLESQHMDFETGRLAMLAEPIADAGDDAV